MSNPFEGYSDHFDAEVRWIILRALSDEPSKSLNDSLLHTALQTFGVKRTRDYLNTQLSWLQDQAGAVRLTRAGTAVIAQLTQTGADHVDRLAPIVGVKSPSLPR